MPRPSPETKIGSYAWEYRQYGYSPTYGTATYTDWSRVWSGTVSPGYPGLLRENPHIVTVLWSRRDPRMRIASVRSNYSWYNWFGPAIGQGVSDPGVNGLELSESNTKLQEVRDVCTQRLISKVSRAKVNIAQNIGEYRQVQSMFTSNAIRLANAFRALKRGDVGGVSDALKLSKKRRAHLERVGSKSLVRNPSSWWLELQYGWLPLVGDVYTGITTFYSRMEQGAVVRVQASASRKVTETASNVAASGVVRYDYVMHQKVASKQAVTFWVDDARLANAQDWGIINPLLLAWELMPYSFVVDWFLPIGNWLSMLDYSLGLTFKEGYQTVFAKTEQTRFYKPVPTTQPPPAINIVTGGPDVHGGAFFRRYNLISFPSVPLPKPDPGGLRGKRIANAMALLGVAFGRKVSLDRLAGSR